MGDLSNEVNDEVLLQAFSAFGSVSEARVMWDMKTGRSRGYGFVAFRDRGDAEKALSSMDGEWLGSRAIRCNWANQKGQPSISQQQAMSSMGMTPTTPYGHHHFPTHGMQSYEMVVAQTPQWQTTCYVGNLTPYTTQNDLVPLFQNFGFVAETRFQSDRGFAFVKMDTHENAAMAICQLSGYNVNGRPLKCSVSGDNETPTSRSSNHSWRSGAKIVLRLDSSMGTRLSNLRHPASPRRHPHTAFHNTAVLRLCHLKVVLTPLVLCQAIPINDPQWEAQVQLAVAFKATEVKEVRLCLPKDTVRCLIALEVCLLAVLVDMDVLIRCKAVTVALQALADILLTVKLATTADTRADSSSNSTPSFRTGSFTLFEHQQILSLKATSSMPFNRQHNSQLSGGTGLQHQVLHT